MHSDAKLRRFVSRAMPRVSRRGKPAKAEGTEIGDAVGAFASYCTVGPGAALLLGLSVGLHQLAAEKADVEEVENQATKDQLELFSNGIAEHE